MKDHIKVVSVWNKPASKWVANTGNSKIRKDWYRMKVNAPHGKKMAMCIVTDKSGRKHTKHMFIED
jgi:hypothetical protein